MQKLANQANFSNWKHAQQVIEEVVETINEFGDIANELNIEQNTINLIKKQLNSVYLENKSLLTV